MHGTHLLAKIKDVLTHCGVLVILHAQQLCLQRGVGQLVVKLRQLLLQCTHPVVHGV